MPEATPPNCRSLALASRTRRSSVRTLMVLILDLGWRWAGLVRNSFGVQRDAVAAIVKAGGRVLYGPWQYKDGRVSPKGEPWWPRWLIELLGIDICFGTLRHVVTVFAEKGLLLRSVARSNASNWTRGHAKIDFIRGHRCRADAILRALTGLEAIELAVPGSACIPATGLGHVKTLRPIVGR